MTDASVFLLLYACTALLCGLLVRGWIHGARREAQLRRCIASDLHDQIGAGLGSIGLLSDVLGGDDLRAEQRAAIAETVAGTATDLGQALSAIVWSLWPTIQGDGIGLGEPSQRPGSGTGLRAGVPRFFTSPQSTTSTSPNAPTRMLSVRQGQALDELHRVVQAAVGEPPELVDRQDPGVLELRGRLGLLGQPTQQGDESARSGRRTLSATMRPSPRSRTVHTSPMPPRPSSSRMSKSGPAGATSAGTSPMAVGGSSTVGSMAVGPVAPVGSSERSVTLVRLPRESYPQAVGV